MTQNVGPALIDMQARQLQHLDLTPSRCKELAREVGGYNETVREAALELDFEHEPADFRKALRALSGTPNHD